MLVNRCLSFAFSGIDRGCVFDNEIDRTVSKTLLYDL
jgi:hypothetical protein